MTEKYIYSFAAGAAEGGYEERDLLGSKGAGLAEMSRLGIPVPPGFIITTQACTDYFQHNGSYPEGLNDELKEHIRRLGEQQGQRFGDRDNPLLISARSGAMISMPGLMDTVLNLGLNDEIVTAQLEMGADPRFVIAAYLRLLTVYGTVVLGLPWQGFEHLSATARAEYGTVTDAELPAEALHRLTEECKRLLMHSRSEFPQEPWEQLWSWIRAAFESWNGIRAREYRRIERISHDLGTAVIIQVMVFGNRGIDCATGIAFTHNPVTGERGIFGEYLINAQGEDVVAGIRTPKDIAPVASHDGLKVDFPEAYCSLEEIGVRLERHFRDIQDIEFTIEHGKLYLLQTRSGKRTGMAALRIAVEMCEEGIIDHREALNRVSPEQLAQVLAPIFDSVEKERAIAAGRLLARGLPAGPGVATGRLAFTGDRAINMALNGPVILVRVELSPEDIVGMHASAGILTSRGGMTSHAAVVARGLGKPCIVGAGALELNEKAGVLQIEGRVFREGDELSIDGNTGEILAGTLHPQLAVVEGLLGDKGEASPVCVVFARFLSWADAERRLKVRTNADTPHDVRVGLALGADGVGLCRTEHMFFGEDRIPWVRQMILAESAEVRNAALARLLTMQQKDFEGMFAALRGQPITIRLLDPPLHEFLPRDEKALRTLAEEMSLDAAYVKARTEGLAEANPMLGWRGCRVGITAPEIYEMQAEAIVRAACVRTRAGDIVRPEIMVPMVGTEQEMIRLRQMTAAVVERVLSEEGLQIEILIGTMIEVPRAALVADKIARYADFFSFSTVDLTQMTYGYSWDDAGRFLPQYVEQGVLPWDPFRTLDEDGVGELVSLACEQGRQIRSDLTIGICGEHGGDPASITFFERVGLDYVSCSPYRVPIARLAAAQARLQQSRDEEGVR
jgi:pyruvate,orthophosphate dikinase